MGDSCTGTPTFTSFSARVEQTFSVSQSTSLSLSIAEPSAVTRALTISGIEAVTELTIPGATATVDVVVPVTISAQETVQIPIATLFAPCSTSEPTSTIPTSTSTSSSRSTPVASDSSTVQSSRSSVANTRSSSSGSAGPPASNGNQGSLPTSTSPSNNTPASETGTLFTTTSLGLTTLPNGSQSTFVATVTTSVAPNGSLNDNNGNSGNNQSSRAVAIGVGVAGGVVALIILVMGITWHIRRKRRNALALGLDESEIWGPDREHKTPEGSANSNNRTHSSGAAGYTYNPYGEGRTTAYEPVPTRSPPRARPLSLGDGWTPRPSVSSSAAGLVVATPGLVRTKTADQILYEAARQDLPRSRTASTAASHQLHGSMTASSHRTHASLTASSHMTHGQRTDSVVGLLEIQGLDEPEGHEEIRQDYQHMMDADIDRPMSPVSVVAPKLAIVNPDADRDL